MATNRKLTEKDTLGFLGDGAQYRYVKALIEDKQKFIEVHSYLNENSFTDESLRKIVHLMNKHYEEKGFAAGYRDLEYLIKDKCKSDVELNQYHTAFNRLKTEKMEDGLSTSVEVCTNYFKKMEMIRVLNNGLISIKGGDFNTDKISHIIEGLNSIEKVDCQEDSFVGDLIDKVLDERPEEKVPTGIPQLDEKLRGGLTKGTVGLLIAGTGVGKSTLASIFSCNAALMGAKTLQIYFEDKDSDIGCKYYAHLTGREVYEFKSPIRKQELKDAILNSHPQAKNALYNRMRIVRMPNGSTSVEDIAAYLRKLIEVEGWKPDYVFIDYLSCMQTTNNEVLRMQNEFQAMERCMKRLESLAYDFNIALWVAQQTNRTGQQANDINKGMSKVQGSFRITQPASVILYLDKTNISEKDTANLFLEKNRGGELAEWRNICMNNGTCKIDLSNIIRTNPNLEVSDDDDFEFNK